NGDGLLDAVQVPNPGGNVRIAINDGRDFLPPVVVDLPVGAKLGSNFFTDANGGEHTIDPAARVIDFDQDGRSDIFLMDAGCNFNGTGRANPVALQAGPGTTFTPVTYTGAPIGQGAGGDNPCAGYPASRVLDINGDGLSDFVQTENPQGQNSAE